jgi:PAS domain S-box-containing protein
LTPELFTDFTRPLPEPHLLVDSDGRILAVNTAFVSQFIPSAAPQPITLFEIALDAPGEITAYLQSCLGSPTMYSGKLLLRSNAGLTEEVPCEGAILRAKTADTPAQAMLRLLTGPRSHSQASEDQLAELHSQVSELDQEIRERNRIEAILSEQRHTLELVASGTELSTILETLVQTIEKHSEEPLLASVMLMDEDGVHLRFAAGSNIPPDYAQAIDGIVITPYVSSCGAAAYRREAVIVEDTLTDDLWKSFRDLAHSHQLRACWSVPIYGTDNSVLGTFAIYYRQPHRPAPRDLQLASMLTRTASIAIEQHKRAQALHFQAYLLDAVDQAVIATDLQGTITYWNRRAEVLYAQTKQDVLGQNILDIAPTTLSRAQAVEVLHELRQGRSWTGEITLYHSDGTPFPASVLNSPLYGPSGELAGIVGVSADITEQKRAEAERTSLLESERVARAFAENARLEAEQASRMKDEFLSVISHELRTPLNSILGWAQLLCTQEFDQASAITALETIERNARSQAKLVEDLLEISSIITGKSRLNVRHVHPASLVQAAIDSLAPSMANKGIHLVVELDEAIQRIAADPDRLQQIAWNLLSNAIKFTPEGGDVKVSLKRAVARNDSATHAGAANGGMPAVHAPNSIEILVRDSGIGIDREFLPFVFDRFRQADSSTTRRHGGLGLGLSIVKHLVELHGGSVEARSKGIGKGSTFIARLPASFAEHSVIPLAVSNLQKSTLQTEVEQEKVKTILPLQGVQILLAEDDRDTRRMLGRIFQLAGAEVMLATSALEAFTLFQQQTPDVLISDIEMPGEDGYSLMHRIRLWEEQHGGHVPALALTAYGRPEDRACALSVGYQLHISKPINPTEFVRTVADLAQKNAVSADEQS